jgi:hypothetical protein
MADHLYVDPEWNRVLGMTDEQIADLGLRELVERCLAKGFVPRITLEDHEGPAGLYLTAGQDDEAATA